MDNLMKNRKWNRVATGVLATVLVFANSITVFAYQDTFHREIEEDLSDEEIERKLAEDTFLFVSDESVMEEDNEVFEETQFLYEKQFVDEEGNIYPIEDGVPYRGCNHTFVHGKSYGHYKMSNGGCIVDVYDADLCSKCNYVVEHFKISTTTYTVCPH